MILRVARRQGTRWTLGLSLTLFLLLIGAALFPVSSARACSQSYSPTELRPGTAFFADEALWVMSVERAWVLLSPDGRVRRAPRATWELRRCHIRCVPSSHQVLTAPRPARYQARQGRAHGGQNRLREMRYGTLAA